MIRRLPLCLAALALAAGCATRTDRDPASVAKAYAAAGHWPEAAREIELAVRANPPERCGIAGPRDLECVAEVAGLLRTAARIQAQAGDVQRAVDHLETALQLSPGDPATWIQLAELENERQNVQDAYVAYRRAAELAPDDIRAVSGLALTADSLGFDREAETAYGRWAELERARDDERQGVEAPPAGPAR